MVCLTGGYNLFHIRAGDRCASGIVGIAENQKIQVIVELSAQLFCVDLKIAVFTQRVVQTGTAAQSDIPFIF